MNDAAPQVVYGLETGRPLQPHANYLRLEGWGFIENGDRTPMARLKIGSEVHEPKSTSIREDVGSRFPQSPHAKESGFEFLVLLPFGLREGVLELSGDGGTDWHKACDLLIPTTPHPIMGQFEPAGAEGVITEATRLAGWCWHPELTISEVVLLQGNTEVPVEWALPRQDVAQRFPDQPAAEFSGFMTRENLPRGHGKIRLQVTTQCGRTYFLDPQLTAKIKQGAFAPPRPPPEMWRLSPTHASAPEHAWDGNRIPAGATNILLVLHGDFTANSAYHVTALANEFIAGGYDCVVAVPNHAETIEAQPDARFLAIEFSELAQLPRYYRDNAGPRVTHIWTPREIVREFWEKLESRFETNLVIHLEDNEEELLREHLSIDQATLKNLPADALDRQVPITLSHPQRAKAFMESAVGITTIYESLSELASPESPKCTFWPAATSAFRPLPINYALRKSLGIPGDAQVVFYHGNTHGANFAEVGELYQAIEQRNQASPQSTWLVRTGRDSDRFAQTFNQRLGLQLIHLGFVKRSRDLPLLMSMADVFVQPGSPGAFNDYRFPSKLPEFFAIGRPVVLPQSNIGAQLQHGRDAYVLKNADAASIAQALETIATDQSLRETLSTGAAFLGKSRFSWSRSADRLIEFYRQAAGLGRPSQRQVDAANLLNTSLNREGLENAP